jgi:hypothetical protein
MYISLLHHACVLQILLNHHTFAQCSGPTSTYSFPTGLTVPFQNLCGKDIIVTVDFLPPTNERTWDNCMERCVNKAPLCYGFDFTPLGAAQFNCWLMNASFPASAAAAQSYVVDAAMLGSAFLDILGRSVGLWGWLGVGGRKAPSEKECRCQV